MTVLIRAFEGALQLRDGGDGRTLHGPVMPWGVEARVLDRGRMVVETFQRGALAGIDPARVPLTARHPRDGETLPIGVTVELAERDDAAWGAWRVSRTALGDEVLELARDRVPLGLSVGFMEVPWGKPLAEPRPGGADPGRARPHRGRQGSRLRRRWRSRGTGRGRPRLGDAAGHPGPQMAVAVGKEHFWIGRGGRPRFCLGGCKRVVFYGDRCPDCQRELRQRKRRKPR